MTYKRRVKRRRIILVFILVIVTLIAFGTWRKIEHQKAVEEELRIEAERIEAERIEAERIEAERVEAERLEAERLEAERLEAEQKAKEEEERLALEKLKSLVVDESYFKDALFIGDSRTEGFQIQSGITEGTFLTYKGLNVNSAMNKPLINRKGEKVTVSEAAKGGQYSKIYVMLGVNELGWASDEAFIKDYKTLVTDLEASHPDATIYIQSIIHVSKKKSDNDKIYNNNNINRYNNLIKEMATENNWYYLDLNTVLSDETGSLIEGASFDGVHLMPDYCKIWYQFLKENTVVKGDL